MTIIVKTVLLRHFMRQKYDIISILYASHTFLENFNAQSF